jgi:hypothetical protein
VQDLRDSGRSICEFTKLAMDSVLGSKRVLASLFHVAYIYAYRVKGFDCLLIEVNPRHVRYYEKILGFRVIGPKRTNRRVNAPAVLMALISRTRKSRSASSAASQGCRRPSVRSTRSRSRWMKRPGSSGRLKGVADPTDQLGYRH